MSSDEFSSIRKDTSNCSSDCDNLVEKIENAYRVYKLSEVFLNDVSDDYGKQKIARLRLEFARHQLEILLDEARGRGVKWSDNEVVRKFLFPGL